MPCPVAIFSCMLNAATNTASAISGVFLLKPIERCRVRPDYDGFCLGVLVKSRDSILSSDAAPFHASPRTAGIVSVMIIDPYYSHL